MNKILAFLPTVSDIFTKQGAVAVSAILAGVGIGLFIEGEYGWMTAIFALLVLYGLLYGKKKKTKKK